MLNEEVQERLANTIVKKIEKLNEYIINEVGKSLLQLGKLTPSKAYQLEQTLKYGASYNKIVKKIEQVTKLNLKQIDDIFRAVAKKNQEFAKQFYDYRNIDFIPYDKNEALKQQVEALANITKDSYVNIMNSSAYMLLRGNKLRTTTLSKIYQEALDEAIISVGQGKEAYGSAIRRIMKELTSKGMQYVDYASGYRRRLDSTIRMNLLDGIKLVSNETQNIFAREYNSNGVEISVHLNPAPDHEKVQGRQFSDEEYKKLNEGMIAKDYKGNEYSLDHDYNGTYRPISTMNCYHYEFRIILGVSKPQYDDKELKEIREKNDKGFDYKGKHYTMYEGTQLQRRLEVEIRRKKEQQIGYRSINAIEEAQIVQRKINKLTKRYKELSEISGLKPYATRMSISGYRRIKA